MKAVLYKEYGGIEKLFLSQIDKPVPQDNEVLIKVRAVSINDWDWALLQKSLFNKITSGWSRPKRQILGSDISGVVEAVGKNVSAFAPGDEVYGDLSGQWGGLAEYVCAKEKMLAKKPSSMSFEQAAAIPQAAMLAVQGLKDSAKMSTGQHILLNGAGGGVGTFAIQLCNLQNNKVSVVDDASKFYVLKNFGAVDFINYKETDFTRQHKKYDIIFDVKTKRSPFAFLSVLNKNGTYVTVGGDLSRLFQFLLVSPFIKMFTSKKMRITVLKPNRDLPEINRLFEEGKIKPVIDERHFGLHEVHEAFRLFESAAHIGKIVINVS